MKRTIQLFFLILLLQIVAFLILMPNYIPSWSGPIKWTSLIMYGLVGIIFIGMTFRVFRNGLREKNTVGHWIRSLFLCLVSCSGIIVGLSVTLLFVFDGVFSARFVKEYKYKTVSATVYVYDQSFNDPRISMSVRNGSLPIQHTFYMSKEGLFPKDVTFDEAKDCLYLYSPLDTLVVDSKQIMKY